MITTPRRKNHHLATMEAAVEHHNNMTKRS